MARLWVSLDRMVTVGGVQNGVVLLSKQSKNRQKPVESADARGGTLGPSYRFSPPLHP